MPTPDCFRDIGAIGARLDEIEKARIERDHAAQIAQTEREARVDAQLRALSHKMDAINAERQQLVGVIWALRILFGGVGAAGARGQGSGGIWYGSGEAPRLANRAQACLYAACQEECGDG